MRTQPPEGDPIIIIAEGSEDIRDLLVDLFTAEGYRVAAGADGATALALARGHATRLVLVDLTMPGVDGATFCRSYRARGGQAPIILMTAAEVDHEAVASYGADAYVVKPFDLDVLLATVARLAGPR